MPYNEKNERSEKLPAEEKVSSSPIANFSSLYQAAAPSLLAWAHARMPPSLLGRMEPNDLVQEIVLRTYEKFENFDGGRSTFRTWMFGIGRNVMMELIRNHAGTKKSAELKRLDRKFDPKNLPAETTTISRRVAKNEYILEFIEKLKQLDPESRDLVVYRGIEGRSHEEVARILGLSLSAAQKKWQRLLSRLDDGSLPVGLFE